MDLNRKIEVKHSALSSLKSELIRKKEAYLQSRTETPDTPRKKFKPLERIHLDNENVLNTSHDHDVDEIDEEDLLRKSRKCLENKALLYDDRVKSADRNVDEIDNESLVNFRQKRAEERKNEYDRVDATDDNSELDAAETCNNYGDDSDWVEYVDFFGRSRKCLREDLEKMKKIDDEFRRTVSTESSQDDSTPDVLSTNQTTERPEFLQKLHEVWEEQEVQLREKQNIHYQDVFFNEARAHGVGYYAFSTDERARATQQAALERLRQETKMLQQVAKQRAVQTLTQSTARVDAAKKRMLQLLKAAVGTGELNGVTAGSEIVSSILTPVEAAMEATQKDVLARRIEEMENLKKEEETEVATSESTEAGSQQEEEDLKRKSHIRPWDAGKDGVTSEQYIGYVRPAKKEIMSQEQWVEKKREERQEEFAPLYEPNKPGVNLEEEPCLAEPNTSLFFSSRRETLKTAPTRAKLTNKFQESFGNDTVETTSAATVHVPSVSETGTLPEQWRDPYAGMSPAEITDAVEAGLKYLRQKAEKKKTKPEKGLMGIV